MRQVRLRLCAPRSAAAVLVPAAALVTLAAAQTTPQKPPTSAQRYKNIRVLKDLPADRLLPTMREYEKALSVKCDFCHQLTHTASGDVGYEKDGMPMKAKAREMIVMMNNLNRTAKTIDGQATCFMCHHGHPEPQTR